MFNNDFDEIFWNKLDADQELYWNNAANEIFKNNKNEIKMNELICTNPKNYKLTLDKKYTVVIDEGETVMIVNDSNKTVRYYKDLFEEPEPVVVRTEQDLINSITSDGLKTTYVDFNNQIVHINNHLQCLSNANSFSCGIKNIIHIGDQIGEIYESIEETADSQGEDLELLTKAVIKHHFNNYIKYCGNNDFNAGIYLMSCNITGDDHLDEEVVEILIEISDFNTEPELNPNSGNEIVLWGFYKSNLDN